MDSKEEASRKQGNPRGKVRVDKEFWRKLWPLLAIAFPSASARTTVCLGLHTFFLVARTAISIVIARLDGMIVRSIVERKWDEFLKRMGQWLLIAWPACITNSMIHYLEGSLAESLRTKLTNHCVEKFMDDEVYYKVTNLDHRLANPDQMLTNDIEKWSSVFAHMHSQISKPLLDILIISSEMGRNYKLKGVNPKAQLQSSGIATLAIIVASVVLKYASPAFGQMVKEKAELEGGYRYVHSRLLSHSEEVAFYAGDQCEKATIMEQYQKLATHTQTYLRSRISYTILESFFLKYFWAAAGQLMIALPVFSVSGRKTVEDDVSARTQDFVTSRGLLSTAADAIERLMQSFKEVTELSGYTHRVATMLEVFDDMKGGKYGDSLVPVSTTSIEGPDSTSNREVGVDRTLLSKRGKVTVDMDGSGNIVFENVPLVTPQGDVLVPNLSFQVAQGRHLLITGPNGCGKSSLFRILGGLWPVYGGSLHKPDRKQLFYIPQTPYLSLGSLCEQVIYPQTVEEFEKSGQKYDYLLELMEVVDLVHIIKREGGWNAIKSWEDVLSGGEKQRIGMARLFHHCPRYAILDECTSAVSIDVESRIYQHAKELGISLLSVSHRPSLWKFHNHMLSFDGQGGYNLKPLNASTLLRLEEEREKLESNLSSVPQMQNRMSELNGLLGNRPS